MKPWERQWAAAPVLSLRNTMCLCNSSRRVRNPSRLFFIAATTRTHGRLMFQFFRGTATLKLRYAILVFATVQLAGCSSPEERAKSYYDHGMQLVAEHDNKRAEIEFRNAVKYDNKLLPAWQALAKIEEEGHNWPALIPVLRNVVELSPNDIGSRIRLGRLLLLGNAVDEALKLVNNVKQEDSNNNADFLALKAAVLFKLKDSAGAVREAQAALQIDPSNTGAMFVLAGDDMARGDAKGALEILNNDAMSKKPDIGVSLFKLQIFEKNKDYKQSEDELHKLIERFPTEVRFKKELIRLYLFQHRNDDAEKEQRAIVAADPKNTQAQLDLVRLLNASKGPAAAQQELTALINAGGDVFPYQIALAELQFAQGKLPDAETILRKLINDGSSPEHAQTARSVLAEMYLRKKQIEAAETLVSDILNKDSRNVSGLRLRAAIHLDRGQFEGAISDLRQALNDQPRSSALMLMLAVAYERSGAVDLAEKEFANAMKASNYDPAVSLNYTAFLRRRGSAVHAEDVLTDLASRWPENTNVLSALADIKLARREYADAQKVAETIKRIGANAGLADELLGRALEGEKKYDESIAAFQAAYASAPTATRPMADLVRNYLIAGKADQANTFLQSVLKASPSNAEANVLLGTVQLAKNAPDQARQSFMTAIEKDAKNPAGYLALYQLYVQQKNYDEALKIVRAGLQQQPDNYALQFSLASTLERNGDYEAAISTYQAMLAKTPGAVVAINNLASLLGEHRTDKDSLDQAKALVTKLQNSPIPQFKDTAGWVNYRLGDNQAAVPLLETAAASLPKDALVHYHLGMAYVAVGQTGKASEQFKIALEQAPPADLKDKIHAAQAKVGTQ